MPDVRCFIDFAAGDAEAYAFELRKFKAIEQWLREKGPKYGLAQRLEDLDDNSRESLMALYEAETQIALTPEALSPPAPLLLPRLYLTVSSSPGLKKTAANFLALITDENKLISKRSPGALLRYRGTPVFRIDKGFVVQTGDVTRQDGSGGESIYGGTFNDEKEGLKTSFVRGTVAMANSGKNSNTSQFFLTLTADPARLKKLTGNYVAFGQVDLDDSSSMACLDQLDALADGKGGTTVKVWIEDCNVVA